MASKHRPTTILLDGLLREDPVVQIQWPRYRSVPQTIDSILKELANACQRQRVRRLWHGTVFTTDL